MFAIDKAIAELVKKGKATLEFDTQNEADMVRFHDIDPSREERVKQYCEQALVYRRLDGAVAEDASQDDYWDATFPSFEFCEYELRNLGFFCDYDHLHETIKKLLSRDDVVQIVSSIRSPSKLEPFEQGELDAVRAALRYREAYKKSEGRVYCGTILENPSEAIQRELQEIKRRLEL